MPEFTTLDELRRRCIKVLESSGLDDAGVPGTQTNLLVETHCARLSEISADNRDGFINHYAQNATGFYLDFIGEERGLLRQSASPAIVLASDQNLKFYTERGNLRDKVGSVIPSNTEVTTVDGTIVFTVNQTPVPAGVSEVYVAASAINLGPAGNVGSRVLTSHSLNVDDVLVVNEKPISSGRNTEPDAIYRQRLLNHMRGTTSITAQEIIAQVMGIPGVTDARYLPTAFGINHPAILMSGPNKLTDSTVSQAAAITRPFLPFGTRLVYLLPDYVELDISVAIRHTDAGNAVNLKSQVPNYVQGLIQRLPIGTSYDFNRLDSEITRTFPNVLNVEAIEVRANGKLHSNRRVKLREHEQMLVSSVTVELI